MHGWMDSTSDDKCSVKKISMEGSVPVGALCYTESAEKASLISWYHLSRHLNERGSFPGRGNSECRGPEMVWCWVAA